MPLEVYATGSRFDGGSRYQEFLGAFIQFHGEEPGSRYATFAYDATIRALEALEQVAQRDNAGNLTISRAAFLNAFNSRPPNSPSLQGAAANYLATAVNGDLNPTGYAVYQAQTAGVSQFEDGDFFFVWAP